MDEFYLSDRKACQAADVGAHKVAGYETGPSPILSTRREVTWQGCRAVSRDWRGCHGKEGLGERKRAGLDGGGKLCSRGHVSRESRWQC